MMEKKQKLSGTRISAGYSASLTLEKLQDPLCARTCTCPLSYPRNTCHSNHYCFYMQTLEKHSRNTCRLRSH